MGQGADIRGVVPQYTGRASPLALYGGYPFGPKGSYRKEVKGENYGIEF